MTAQRAPRDRRSDAEGTIRTVSAAARRALCELTALTGHDDGSVISVERQDGGWQVGIELVETHRIPDSADILAAYQVRLEPDGELHSYRRTRRYARGQTDRRT